MRSHTRLRRAVSTGAVAVVGLFVMPMAAWAQPGAEITISKSRVQIGEQIQVVGKGFAPGASVSVQVCGTADKLGRLSCGPGLSNVLVAADGSVNETISVNEPAGECPCSVVIDSVDTAPVITRIELVGHPMAKVAKAPEIVVDKAEIEPSKGIGHLFGFAPQPRLNLTLRNAGVSPAAPTLNLSWRDGDGEASPITDPGVPMIEPGESVQFSVPLKYGALAQGEHTVSGQVVIGDLYAAVEASNTVAPWGLYALAALVLGGGALLRVRRVSASDRASDRAPARSRVATPSRRSGPVPAQSRRMVPNAAADPAPEPAPEPAPAPVAAPVAAVMPAGPTVGPPRLAATPLSPLPGLTPSWSPSSAQPASVESETLVAPSVPHQVSRQHTPADDAATVARAMAVIQTRSDTAPAQLPDRYEVAPEPGRRAERGGKRAARPEKGRGWITRR